MNTEDMPQPPVTTLAGYPDSRTREELPVQSAGWPRMSSVCCPAGNPGLVSQVARGLSRVCSADMWVLYLTYISDP
ncbi:hypothetical protein CRUP_020637 [Coryphaenoides rupestris]|nr:hypothetical protein CRUP_020637 [Coryphaenoides rupestris]